MSMTAPSSIKRSKLCLHYAATYRDCVKIFGMIMRYFPDLGGGFSVSFIILFVSSLAMDVIMSPADDENIEAVLEQGCWSGRQAMAFLEEGETRAAGQAEGIFGLWPDRAGRKPV